MLELYCFEKRHVIVLIQQTKVGPASLVVSVMEAQRGNDLTPPFMQGSHMQGSHMHNKVYNHTIIL